MVTIIKKIEVARGCGFREPGGKYLVSGGMMAPCGRLPVPCDVCPTCHGGVKPSRGWTWIDIKAFMKGAAPCRLDAEPHCLSCPLNINRMPERVGLLWIGELFYPTPEAFMQEAQLLGVSRRISAVPNDFKIGETWVFFAHRKTFKEVCGECDGKYSNLNESESRMEPCEWCTEGYQYKAGMFHAFRPTAIEYVVKGTETEEELERLEEQGFTLVDVIRNETPMFEQEIRETEGVDESDAIEGYRAWDIVYFDGRGKEIERTQVDEVDPEAREQVVWDLFKEFGHKRTKLTRYEETEVIGE